LVFITRSIMKIFKFRNGEAFTIIIIVVIIVIFLGWLINFNSKECRSNSQCPADYYCGSDFSCHQIPVIEKTTIKNNLIIPSIIIGIAIIIATFVLKFWNRSLRNNSQQEEEHEKGNEKLLKIP